jgi:hypothetical protein
VHHCVTHRGDEPQVDPFAARHLSRYRAHGAFIRQDGDLMPVFDTRRSR